MAQNPYAAPAVPAPAASANHTRSLVIVTILFFMWGLLTSLNDVLVPHLKAVYTLSNLQAALVQFCFFGAYFVVSLPAGSLIHRIGYQRGAVTGLLIAAAGCALFYPAATSGYWLFLCALFVLASGITILQVAANPYVTLLGPAQTASSRLTLTQAFNSLGTTVGPYFGSILILAGGAAAVAATTATDPAAQRAAEASSVQVPYLILAGLLALLAVLFALARLPRIDTSDAAVSGAGGLRAALGQRHLLLGAIAIFLYVGGEVAIGSFLVNFFERPEIGNLPAVEAGKLVTYYWGGAMVGRFLGFAVMRVVAPGKVLAFNAAMVIVLVLVAIMSTGSTAMWAILAVGLFNSIMFPTIFSMAIHRLGPLTGEGSGVLCMAIVGGAIVPVLMGAVADRVGLQLSFVVPMLCYVFILYFGAKYARLFRTADDLQAG
jgi:FHS family L-fucose permease-like MFS transporter